MSLTILQGDWIEQLCTLPENHFHCCVTSPPYWGLRNYGMDGQLGLEKSIDEYVEKMVAGFREVRRVLRADGTCWLNIGDCYSGAGLSGGKTPAIRGTLSFRGAIGSGRVKAGLKPKDLCMMPARIALALQADGWYLRSDIIWHKPNPMPESVIDRPANCYEHIFLLTKSSRYFYDNEAVKEPVTGGAHARGNGVNPKAKWKTPDGRDTSVGNGGHGSFHKNGREKGKTPGKNSRIFQDRDPHHSQARKSRQNESFSAAVAGLVSKRNRRNVWTIATHPFKGAHFATFPPKLVEPCIFAGTSEAGCCPTCGAQYRRVTKKGEADRAHQLACGGDVNGEYHGSNKKNYQQHRAQPASTVKARILAGMCHTLTVGFAPACKCPPAQPAPCHVIDPFGGSGTTAMVALKYGRHATIIELNPDYVRIAEQRCAPLYLNLLA